MINMQHYKPKYKPKFYLLLFLGAWMISCDTDDVSVADNYHRGDLIEAIEKGTLDKQQLIERITELPANDFAQYTVSYRAITYRTLYMGKPIDTRGLLLIPEGAPATRLLMYCHGTELPSARLGAEKITPSLYKGQKEDFRDVRNMGLSWATAGYTVFMPDYVGYGITLGKDHPYMYLPEMFLSNIDGLLAVKEIFRQEGIDYDNRLFIAGWSQGAAAGLSAHKYIQEAYQTEFSVVASSGLAGPYNFKRFAESFLERRKENITAMPIFSWGMYAINKFSDLRRPTDQLFSYPVYDQFSSILVPSGTPNKVFNHYFLDKWADGSDTTLIQILENNTFSQGWKPTGKVFLHHGDADNLVPSYNTDDAYTGLTNAGGDVKKYIYPTGDHASELDKFIANTLNDFNELP